MSEKKALNRLIQEIAESVSKDAETAKSYLASEGVDTSKLVEEGGALIRKIEFLKQAAENEESDKALEEMAWKRILQTAKEKAISELEAIKFLIPNLQGAPALYSKLEKLSEDDLKKALQEEGVLKLMEKLDKDKDGE